MEQKTLQPTKLRIGNWFYEKPKSTQSLEKIPHRITNGRDIDNSEFYSPIPLTPDILEKCGFLIFKDDVYRFGRLQWWRNLVYLKNEDTDECYYIPNECKYLHQLQNLYFALCGKELEITL